MSLVIRTYSRESSIELNKRKVKNMNNVIFHYLPPAVLTQPSAAYSVLSSYLIQNEINTEIKYWNIMCLDLFKEDIAEVTDKVSTKYPDIIPIIPFLIYNYIKYKESNSIEKLKAILKLNRPEMIVKDSSYYDGYLIKQQSLLKKLIQRELNSCTKNPPLLHAFSARFDQWQSSIIILDIIKKMDPNQKIVIGGFDSKDEAQSIMSMIDSFDFAIWGEGENALLKLCNSIKNNNNYYKSIPNLVYREDNKIISSPSQLKVEYTDLDNITPNYDDYIRYLNKYNIDINTTFLPIENGRGCSWNRCRFCTSNTIYKTRTKNINAIINDIEICIKKYAAVNYVFTGTDIVCLQDSEFDKLLNQLLVMVKNSNYEFTFIATIIPKNVSIETIKKLSMLNFIVQIGYEATSDRLLKKMDKISRFADILYFLKFSHKYALKLKGANVITRIVDEVEEDITEATENLPFLRFFLGENDFSHNKSKLHIKKGSEFYNQLKQDDKEYWRYNVFAKYLPEKLMYKLENRFTIFAFSTEYSKYNSLWNDYWNMEEYYRSNRFYAKIIELNNHAVYKEYCNGLLIKSITLSDPLYLDVLNACNKKVMTLKEIKEKLLLKYKNLSDEKLWECLDNLKSEYLVFYNKEIKRSIISVIDVT